MNLIHHIGEEYCYREGGEVFILKEFIGFVYVFECGHRVSDSVFADLIRVKTLTSVRDESNQLTLF